MKFSIITAVRNNKDSLQRAVESLRVQTFRDYEHIIIDGASTDGTVEVLEQLQDDRFRIESGMTERESVSQGDRSFDSAKGDTRTLKWISEPDNGIYDALNKGIKMASGDIIGLLHSDDLFADEFVLSKVAENFQQKNVDAVYGDLVYVHSSDINKAIRYWKSGEYNPKKMIYGWMPPHPAVFIKREIFSRFGYYNPDYNIAADYEMILRLLWKNKISISYLPVVLTKMSWGGASNKNFGNLLAKSKEDYIAMKKNDLPLPCFTLALKNIRKISQFIPNKYT